MPVFLMPAGWKLLGQVVFLAAGITCLALHEREAGMLIIGGAIGSVVPIAERRTKE